MKQYLELKECEETDFISWLSGPDSRVWIRTYRQEGKIGTYFDLWICAVMQFPLQRVQLRNGQMWGIRRSGLPLLLPDWLTPIRLWPLSRYVNQHEELSGLFEGL